MRAIASRCPSGTSDVELAPLLCAGLIGYRALKLAGPARRLGIYGFGAAAHIVAQVAVAQQREVYAFTRAGDAEAQEFARSLGACWAGASLEAPPAALDAALIFAPVGALVPAALRAVRKGGSVVCGGIHMSDVPAFPYALLWGERVLRSVANLTRADAAEFFDLVQRAPVRTHCVAYPLAQANQALADLRAGRVRGAAVLVPRDGVSAKCVEPDRLENPKEKIHVQDPRDGSLFRNRSVVGCGPGSVRPAPRPPSRSDMGGDRFIAGSSVSLSDAVAGDLFAAGGSVESDASVGGDAVLAGGKLRIGADVAHSVLATGGQITINGQVGRNVRAAGGQIEFAPASRIVGNVSVAGGQVNLRGAVLGHVQAAGGRVFIDGPIGGDVLAASGQVELGPNARIAGSLRYRSGDSLRQDPAAQVRGGAVQMMDAPGAAHDNPMHHREGRGLAWRSELAVDSRPGAAGRGAVGASAGRVQPGFDERGRRAPA